MSRTPSTDSQAPLRHPATTSRVLHLCAATVMALLRLASPAHADMIEAIGATTTAAAFPSVGQPSSLRAEPQYRAITRVTRSSTPFL
jgi:hypothetical protein